MRLSRNFHLSEMVASQTAARLGIKNEPDLDAICNMERLCVNTLQPIRDRIKRPAVVSSGFRCPSLDAAIRGMSLKKWEWQRFHAKTHPVSGHVVGEAADFEIPGVDNLILAKWISRSSIPFDQLILEYYTPGDPTSGWIHISYREAGNRRQLWHKRKNRRYKKGLPR